MTELLLRLFVKDYRNVEQPSVRASIGKLAGVVGIVCNSLLFTFKLVAGLIAGSVSIIADALNNLSDASSSLVTLMGFKLAQRPADKDHPYGHARYEYLSGFIVSGLIFVIGIELAKSSVEKIINPEAVELSVISVGILVASILLKLWMSLFCRNLGKRIDSTTLQATSVDSRNDVISTTAVLAGCVIGYLFDIKIDGYIGLGVALFIIYSGITLAKETMSPLLGKQADEKLVDDISELVLSHDKIIGMHDLLVHDYGPGQCFASVHAELNADEDPLICHDIIDDIERNVLEQLSVHLVIHYDPVVTDDEELNYMRNVVVDIIIDFDSRLSLHDFRMVRGAKRTKLVFDLVIPYSMEEEKYQLKEKIDKGIKSEGKHYDAVICFDKKA
ncbi:MAG: cation diffusion facilitator family transporter [Acutalibacteraceae bacterium]|nr:cation diffusion facilitator family transporter [Acutalibacteraceae bacterium]